MANLMGVTRSYAHLYTPLVGRGVGGEGEGGGGVWEWPVPLGNASMPERLILPGSPLRLRSAPL